MERLSDFEELIRECKPTHFVFISDEQEQRDNLEPCAMRFDFSELFVDIGSQSVFAKSESGSMCIERIVGVDVEDSPSLIGRIVIFKCGGKQWNTKDYTYKFLIA